jgi:hypothetical protein
LSCWSKILCRSPTTNEICRHYDFLQVQWIRANSFGVTISRKLSCPNKKKEERRKKKEERRKKKEERRKKKEERRKKKEERSRNEMYTCN